MAEAGLGLEAGAGLDFNGEYGVGNGLGALLAVGVGKVVGQTGRSPVHEGSITGLVGAGAATGGSASTGEIGVFGEMGADVSKFFGNSSEIGGFGIDGIGGKKGFGVFGFSVRLGAESVSVE